MSRDDLKAAVLVRTEVVYANGGLVHPRPRRPGSRLKTFEPSLWEARCPDCRTLIASIRQVRTDITGRGPYVPSDAPDNPNDGASAEFHIGTVVTLEPGFVNAPRRTQVASWLERPTYHRSNRRARTPALRIRKPAIVVCKCGSQMLLDWPKGDQEYASATKEERERMAFESFEKSEEREYGMPIRQLMKDRNLTLAEAIREIIRGR
ncbi:MAG: hypothetical protein ACREMY_14015 [bacterium]